MTPHERLFGQDDELNPASATELAVRHGIQNSNEDWDNCLRRELQASLIEELYPYLWLVSKKAGHHIDALHEQIIKKRSIIPAENPRLHLVWHFDKIYIKPVPDYLLSFTIWQQHIQSADVELAESTSKFDKYRNAAGFLRTYAFLIQHELDFIIAQSHNLVPQDVSFQRFQQFISKFRDVGDDDVAPRYHFGQIRLNRLNWTTHIVKATRVISFAEGRFPWNYQETYWEITQYLQVYVAPLVFIFAALSVVLSSMQVMLAVKEADARALAQFCWGFSLTIIIFSFTLVTIAAICIVAFLLYQFEFAVRTGWKPGKATKDKETRDS